MSARLTGTELHKDLMKHYPWHAPAGERREKFVSREDLEKILRTVLDAGDWAARLAALREALLDLEVRCE